MSNNEKDELALTFLVPETDFSGLDVELALIWLEEQLAKELERHPMSRFEAPSEYSAIGAAYRIMKRIHDKYCDAVGRPEWKRQEVEL